MTQQNQDFIISTNIVSINPDVPKDQQLDNVLIETSDGASYVFVCDTMNAPNYKVILFPLSLMIDEDEETWVVDSSRPLWSTEFFAIDNDNKNLVLTDMLIVVETEDLTTCCDLLGEFGGQCYELHEPPKQVGIS